MAVHENPLPEGGNIVADIQSGGLSRRNFVMMMGVAGATVFGSSLYSCVETLGALTKTPVMMDAKGVLIHDVTRCVACRRCELACSEFNDGAASSYLSRVKVGRNMSATSASGGLAGPVPGKYGNFRVAADTCKQCPHPVPCAEACPKGAIRADAKTGARKVDESVCTGCGICTKACPWAVITVNPATNKASKCFLCDGSPECVRACPTGALKFISWRDLRLSTPPVQSGIMADPSTSPYCSPCHS
jgi:Fe-S-cluster-containing dehydrogenase component